MKIAFSWDDGACEDNKLFDLHEKYNIPGMFFVPTVNSEGREVITPSDMRKANEKLISFGGHTHNHLYLTDIPLEEVESEIENNKKYLEDALARKVDSFCFPGGKYNDEIIKIARRHFLYLRTADTMCFKKPVNNLLKPSIHFYPRGIKSLLGNANRNKSYRELALTMANITLPYFDMIKKYLEYEKDRDSYFMIWGHSWELEENNLWKDLENLMKLIASDYHECVSTYNKFFLED